jgi:dGTPase
LVPLNLCAETLDGIRNHSWSRPAPQTPEGEVVSWADRIAYVCHDFEDAVATGIVSPSQLPDIVRTYCGETRSSQLRAFISSMIGASLHNGRVGKVSYRFVACTCGALRCSPASHGYRATTRNLSIAKRTSVARCRCIRWWNDRPVCMQTRRCPTGLGTEQTPAGNRYALKREKR